MTYKETLFFVGKCLTINHIDKNKFEIETELKTNLVDWDSVVKVSTEHYVFPALYCNLKKANFLHYLPEDLVGYMEHITNLNRERNQKIIAQAKEINELLLANNIIPIFLKGTGNLLEGLYEDVGERMVGDIDFIVSIKNYKNTISILKNDGYENVHKQAYIYPEFKHYPKIHKEGKKTIASVEIHKELIAERFSNEFNYKIIQKDCLLINEFYVLNYQNQLNLTIIAKQINDFGNFYKSLSLRNAYDLFLLANKTNALEAISQFKKLYIPLNNFLAICYEVMGKTEILNYKNLKSTKKYIYLFKRILKDEKFRKTHNYIASWKVFFTERLEFIRFSFQKKEYRDWIFKRLKDKNWQKEKIKNFNYF